MDSSKDSRLKRKKKKQSLEKADLGDLHRIEQEQKMVKDLLPGYKVCSTPSLFDACLQTDFPLDDKDTMSLHSSVSARGALSANVSTHSLEEEDLPTPTDEAYLMPDFIGIKFSQKVHILLKDAKKTTTVNLNLDNMEKDEIVLKVSEWPIGEMQLWVEGYEIFPQRAPDLPYYITITTEYRKFSLEEAMLFGVDPQHAERERVAWRQRERRERRKQESAGKTVEARSSLKKKSVQTQTLVHISPNIVTTDLEPYNVTSKGTFPIPEATPSTSSQRYSDEKQMDKRRRKVLDHEYPPSHGEIDSQLNHELAKLEKILANFDSEIIKQASALDSSKTKTAIREAIEAINRLYPPLAAAERTKLYPNEHEALPSVSFAKEIFMKEVPLQNDVLGDSISSEPSGTSSQTQSEDTHEQSKASMFSSSPDASSHFIIRELGIPAIPGPSLSNISKDKQLGKEVAGSKSGVLGKDPPKSDLLLTPKETQMEPAKSERSDVTSPEQLENSGAFKPLVVSLAPITNSHQLQNESAEELDPSKPVSSSPLSDLKIPQLESPHTKLQSNISNAALASTETNSQQLEKRKAASEIVDSFELPSSSITPIKSSKQTNVGNSEGAMQSSDSFLPLVSPLLPPDSISRDLQNGRRDPSPSEKSSQRIRSPKEPQKETEDMQGPDPSIVPPMPSPSLLPEHQQNIDSSLASPEHSERSSHQLRSGDSSSSFPPTSLGKLQSGAAIKPASSVEVGPSTLPVPSPVPSPQQFQVLAGPHLAPVPIRPWPFVPPSLSQYYPRREIPDDQLCGCTEGVCLGHLRPAGTSCRARLLDWNTPLVEVQRELMRPYLTAPPPAGPPPPPPPPSAQAGRPPMRADPQDFTPDQQPSSSAKK